MAIDIQYMKRALQLARCGIYGASPNPMVGAVVVDNDGTIIGEGYHRRCGEGHAEVNAIASVADKSRLKYSTIYVTLEPCSHYGKTPPCAQLIIDSKIHRVVIGCQDPFAAVSGRGIAMLREAGIDVTVGILEHECLRINRRFITAHTLHRPFITLKWAQSIDGYIDHKRATDEPPAKFSTQLGTTLVHRIRSIHDAITVGTGTIAADRPRLDTRYWPGGQSPIKALNDCSYSLPDYGNAIILHEDTVESYLNQLYKHGITSLLVEGGAKLLQSFINNNLWDDIRIEISPYKLSEHGSIKAPTLPINNFAQQPTMIEQIEHNKVLHYTNLTIGGVKNL